MSPSRLFLGRYRTACAIRLGRVRLMNFDIGSIGSLTKANDVGDGESPQKTPPIRYHFPEADLRWPGELARRAEVHVVFNKHATSHSRLMLSTLCAGERESQA